MQTTPTQHLFQASNEVFLDPSALILVRFEGYGQDARAHLKYKGGGSEIISGEAVNNLHQHLTSASNTLVAAPLESVQESKTDSEPPKSFHLKTVVVPGDTTFLGRNKGWFYRKDKSGRSLILAFVNAKGSCSVRPFDGETGMAMGKRYSSGPYQKQFADLVEGATEVTVDSQPNLERDCKQRLPERLFAYLRKQIEQIPS